MPSRGSEVVGLPMYQYRKDTLRVNTDTRAHIELSATSWDT